MSFQPAEPGANSYYIYAYSGASWLFQFEIKLNANDQATEAQLDTAFQQLVTAIDSSPGWSVSQATKHNVDDQQVTP